MGGGMAQPTEQEIVSKHLNTKEGDIFSLAEMKEKFDFQRISLGGPVFDLVKLKWLNGEYIRKLSPDNVLPPEAVWLPKKRTPEDTLAFAVDQLATLEASAWDAAGIEAELKKLG